jgi:hypothetical protein
MPEVKYRVGMNVQGEVVWCFMGFGERTAKDAKGAKKIKKRV